MNREPGRRDLRWVIMLVCACGSAWLYWMMVRLLPKMPSAEPTEVHEVFPWVRAMTQQTIESIHGRVHGFGYLVRFFGCCAGLFLCYGVMLCVARGVRSGWFVAWAGGAAVVFSGILLCAPAMLSNDAYYYSFYGRLLGVYGLDAHAAVPAARSGDLFLVHGWYEAVPSVYGPLWTVISAGVVWIGGGRVGLTILLFRLVEAAAVLKSGALIWLILRKVRPELAAVGTILFLWNPLVLIESPLGGHNDACMMVLALGAVWLHLRGWKVGAVVALTLSALVKVITGPLVPLYILMAVRECPRWKERCWFLARAGIGAAAAVALSMAAGRMEPSGMLAQRAGSAGFYKNNYHELVFKGLRRMLGERAETLDAPMDFQTWWVEASDAAELRVGLSNKSKGLARLKAGAPLLALSDKDSRTWLRVFDPADRLIGFVQWTHLYVIAAPANAQSDPVVRELSISPQDWPTVVTANRWIRLTTWGLFGAFGLLAAWKARDFWSFLSWSTAFFLAAELLVFTRIWPWYGIWPLAICALIPTTGPARLGILLSAGMAVSYALLGCCNTQLEWVYDYRSLFTIVLPVAVFAVIQGCSSLADKFGRREVAVT